MAKPKKIKRPLVPLFGRGQAIPEYESYNPLLEDDSRVSRRFSVGLVTSLLVNVLMFAGAAAIASQISPPAPDEGLPPAQFTMLEEIKRPEPTPTPEAAKPTPPPHREARVRPTPPPERRVRPERPRRPVQVAINRPRPVERPTPPPPVPKPQPTPVHLEQQKLPEPTQEIKTPAQQVASAASPSRARRVAEVPQPTTEALSTRRESGSSQAVQAPTHRTTGPIGGMTTAMGPRTRQQLSELSSNNSPRGGEPSVNVGGAAGAAGAGPALNARVGPAVGASNDTSELNAKQTATAGNASVLSPSPTREIKGPLAMTGPRLARSKALTALSSTDRTDANSFSYNQGSVVTAGKVVGTQGSTSARVGQVASAGDAVEARFEGVSNGVAASSRGSEVIRGPRIAAGSPGLTGPRARTTQLTGLAGGQMGAPGNFNSVSPGGGGVAGVGAGGGGGSSLKARGVGVGGVGGIGGGGLKGQYGSGTGQVASSRIGRPNDGPAQSGAATGPTNARGHHLTSVGGLDGPDAPAGSPEGTPGGGGRAGISSGKGVFVEGAPSGASAGDFNGGSGGGSIEAGGRGRGGGSGPAGGGGKVTNTGDKVHYTRQAEPTRSFDPTIPDNMRNQAYRASVEATFTIHKDGSFDVRMTRKSGNSQIDSEVESQLKKWRWKPAMSNNQPVESTRTYQWNLQVK